MSGKGIGGPTPKPGILEIAPYVGGESTIVGHGRAIKLSSNENAFGPSPKAVKAFIAAAETLYRYPDGGCTALRAALAAHHGLQAERIVCGAGSDELLSLLARAYAGPGDEVLYSEHEFLMYPIAALSAGATPIKVRETDLTADVDLLLAAVTERTRIVFIANPNNPTGTYLPAAAMHRLRDGLPRRVLLVIDAAYAEFVTRPDYAPGLELVEADGNVVVTRTFSKIYGLGGLRLGWAYCPAAVADVLNRVRGPFNVSAPAMSAGAAALDDTDFVAKVRAHNETWREWTAVRLRDFGLTVTPGVANFLLVHFPAAPDRDAGAADAFLKARGIIVRRMERYGLPGALRVTIGRESEMRAFIEALAAFVGAKGG
jgi:histidinol-phosphate aminotransferase